MFEDSTFESARQDQEQERALDDGDRRHQRFRSVAADPHSADLSRGAAQGRDADGTDCTASTASAASATSAARSSVVKVQSEMMNNQLTAPTRIPHDIKIVAPRRKRRRHGLWRGRYGRSWRQPGGAIGGVFGGANAPKVQAAPPKKINISAGVAAGMLIQKTQPIYPPIAKAARVRAPWCCRPRFPRPERSKICASSAGRRCCSRPLWMP